MDPHELEQENSSLRTEIDSLKRQLEIKSGSSDSLQALQLAELIINNSPAVLFRRLAADNPEERALAYVSPNISRFGYRAEDFLSGRLMFRDIVSPEDSERTLAEIRAFVEQGIERYTQTYRIVTSQGKARWVEDRTSVYEEPETGLRYHQGIVIDIHEQKTAEIKLRESEEKHRRIVETAGEGFILMDESFRVTDINSAYARMVKESRADLVGRRPFNLSPELYHQYWSDGKDSSTTPHYREFECDLTAGDGRTVPVLIHANTLRSDRHQIIGNMAFVTDMTAQKKALQLAAEVQKGLLPEKAPVMRGLDIAGQSLPCDEVGGDYYDYLLAPGNENERAAIVVGDISGHGVDSALLMSSARACLRMRAQHSGSSHDIVATLNRHLAEDVGKSGRFMTLFYLSVERDRNRIEWVRAGHDPALLYDPLTDQFDELRGPGLALGVDKEFLYTTQRQADMKPGQIIALITDGIWEECNQKGEMFGKDRLKKIIRENSEKTAGEILENVFHGHRTFTAGVENKDDITLVIVKITEDH